MRIDNWNTIRNINFLGKAFLRSPEVKKFMASPEGKKFMNAPEGKELIKNGLLD